jgi:hypothetical protein
VWPTAPLPTLVHTVLTPVHRYIAFRVANSSGDGALRVEELTSALTSSGVAVPSDLAQLLERCDANRSGTINLVEARTPTEVATFVCALALMLPGSMLGHAVCCCDDGSGRVRGAADVPSHLWAAGRRS